jgi:hypothetical protein
MKTIIFILLITAHEKCLTSLSDSPNGHVCEDAKFKWYNTYIVNSKPCWDYGTNEEIGEKELQKYNKAYKVIVEPDGSRAYCPKKGRTVKFNGDNK